MMPRTSNPDTCLPILPEVLLGSRCLRVLAKMRREELPVAHGSLMPELWRLVVAAGRQGHDMSHVGMLFMEKLIFMEYPKEISPHALLRDVLLDLGTREATRTGTQVARRAGDSERADSKPAETSSLRSWHVLENEMIPSHGV
eukprot:s1302_g8.t1